MDAEDKLRVFTLACFAVPLAFLFISGSKLAGYICLVFRQLGCWRGCGLRDLLAEGSRRCMALRITGALLLLIGVTSAVITVRGGLSVTHNGCDYCGADNNRRVNQSLPRGQANTGCSVDRCGRAFGFQ